MTTEPLLSAPPLPGGVGISRLRVYDWEGPDGLRGGSPHVHLVCSEAYLVLDGAGAVQTIGPAGFNETPVERGSLLWFTPGLIHRLINHGDLEIIVLMQIATLPEAGDCILSFPDEAPLNMFMNIPVGPGGAVSFEPSIAGVGSHVTLRAEMDLVIVFSACPQDIVPINGADCVPKEVPFQFSAGREPRAAAASTEAHRGNAQPGAVSKDRAVLRSAGPAVRA